MSGISKFTGNSFLLATAVAFLFSCTNNSKNNLTVFKALDESLVRSNRVIVSSNENVYHALDEKLYDFRTSTKAGIWQPKAMQIQKLSQEMINYIDSLKTELKKEAGLKEEGVFTEDDVNAVNTLFNKKSKGEELYTKLKKYKPDILAVDFLIMSEFEKKTILTTVEYDNSKKGMTFTKTFFNEISTIEASAILDKFQNNIRIIENKTVSFCYEQVPSNSDYFNTYSAIIAQNIRYVKAGEEIEIIAGVGAFSRIAKPEITIKGKIIPIDETGTATVKFLASGKRGNYFVPVKINFTDQEGKKQTITKTVEYTIAKE
jgi:gliding motility-associated protein GldM